MDKSKEIDLYVHRAIIELPENTVALTIAAKVYMDGEIKEVLKDYSISEIREMFRKADDGYIDENDRFMITEKGLAWLEEQERLKNN